MENNQFLRHNFSAGATPLHLAACLGNTAVMRLLLDGRADGEAVDQRGGNQVEGFCLVSK